MRIDWMHLATAAWPLLVALVWVSWCTGACAHSRVQRVGTHANRCAPVSPR